MKISDLQAHNELVDLLFSQYLSVEQSQTKSNASSPTFKVLVRVGGSPVKNMIIFGGHSLKKYTFNLKSK